MRTFLIVSAAAACMGLPLSSASAQERVLVDNWNTAACGFTDTSTLVLNEPTVLSRIDLWFNWNGGEGAVAYTLLANGTSVTAGTLKRADCDPYQGAWCVARDTPNLQMQPGQYQFVASRAGLCQNAGSQGAGFIRAYGR